MKELCFQSSNYGLLKVDFGSRCYLPIKVSDFALRSPVAENPSGNISAIVHKDSDSIGLEIRFLRREVVEKPRACVILQRFTEFLPQKSRNST